MGIILSCATLLLAPTVFNKFCLSLFSSKVCSVRAQNSTARDSFGFSPPHYLLVRSAEAGGEVRCVWVPAHPACGGGHVLAERSIGSWALACLWCLPDRRSAVSFKPEVAGWRPKEPVTMKYNWISAWCADSVAALSGRIVVQAGLSHFMLRYVFVVEQFHAS